MKSLFLCYYFYLLAMYFKKVMCEFAGQIAFIFETYELKTIKINQSTEYQIISISSIDQRCRRIQGDKIYILTQRMIIQKNMRKIYIY